MVLPKENVTGGTMPTEIRMNINERRKYLMIVQPRYLASNRKGRTELLDEMQRVTALDRKTLIRLINGRLQRRPRRRQRGRTYGHKVDDALRVIWESLDYICAERLTPGLASVAELLADHGEIMLTPELLDKLRQISISTVGRILKRITQDTPRLPRKRPRPTNSVTRDVPMKRIPRGEKQPGHFEADLVHHGGPSASGEYVHTLQFVDVATGWSERVAILGRSFRTMEDGCNRILARTPFPVLEVHPDNGSEFFNHHMKRFWKERAPDVHLSRSHPYRKNDNRLVEQKNSTLVRAYLGYDRLDSVAQTLALNLLYVKMWIYYNLFQPVMHLQEKIYFTGEDGSSRVTRRFDKAQTPFERLCATDAISPERREQLEQLRKQTNPRRLRKEIYALIDHIFSLPGAVPGVTEDIFQTLLNSNTHRKEEAAQ